MIFEKIAAAVAAHSECAADAITMETSFEELGIDSLDTVEMVMKLEEELGIELDMSMSDKLVTVGDLAALIEAQLSADQEG